MARGPEGVMGGMGHSQSLIEHSHTWTTGYSEMNVNGVFIVMVCSECLETTSVQYVM